jgi:chromosome segregation ATPase
MHIEEVVVDGFKSYAHRTVVPGFDPFFNAITGLNGSGKSNILDSICFVLGITNLSQARGLRGRRAKAVALPHFESAKAPAQPPSPRCLSRSARAACRSWCTNKARRA